LVQNNIRGTLHRGSNIAVVVIAVRVSTIWGGCGRRLARKITAGARFSLHLTTATLLFYRAQGGLRRWRWLDADVGRDDALQPSYRAAPRADRRQTGIPSTLP